MEQYPEAMETIDKKLMEGKLDDEILRNGVGQNMSILKLGFVERMKAEEEKNIAEELQMKEEV